MMLFLARIIVVALIAAFVLTLARKWGIIENAQIHGNDFVARLFSCNFCLSWWVCLFISIIWFVATGDLSYLGVPFAAPMITRFLL